MNKHNTTVTSKKFLKGLAAIALLTGYLTWQNNGLTITRYYHSDMDVPASFNGFNILQVSDLHNKTFGKNQEVLLGAIDVLNPDIIVITGDLIDRRRYNLEAAMAFVTGAMDLAPVYYVPGNHEAWSGRYDEIREALQKAGVVLLEDQGVTLERSNDTLHLLGLVDPAFQVSSHRERWNTDRIASQLNQWQELEGFKLLLAHRPELFRLYADSRMDLVLSGHAHGGQVRLPVVGALLAPDQGFFPSYASGDYHQGNATMVVSRGLGNSLFPFRVNNRPELVLVTLQQN